ncbi:MAG: hypothetical protein JO125_07075, partial [Chloroflexi bacterium]|nr:hypothetical protein [Chloroflexota bacterium]
GACHGEGTVMLLGLALLLCDEGAMQASKLLSRKGVVSNGFPQHIGPQHPQLESLPLR